MKKYEPTLLVLNLRFQKLIFLENFEYEFNELWNVE